MEAPDWARGTIRPSVSVAEAHVLSRYFPRPTADVEVVVVPAGGSGSAQKKGGRVKSCHPAPRLKRP